MAIREETAALFIPTNSNYRSADEVFMLAEPLCED